MNKYIHRHIHTYIQICIHIYAHTHTHMAFVQIKHHPIKSGSIVKILLGRPGLLVMMLGPETMPEPRAIIY